MISVIVPVYNVERYLQRCVDSILNQTFTDFELILVDDGSPDNSGKICDECLQKDNRIKVIHKKNGGLSDARNTGIDWVFANSDSEWITFIDSDDWVHPRYLEGMISTAEKFNASISVSGYIKTEKFCPFERIIEFDAQYMDVEYFFVNYNTIATIACGKIYKREYFITERYPFGKLNEDEFVTYKLLFQNDKIAFVTNPMYFYFNNANGIMNSKWTVKKLDGLEACKMQFKFFKHNRYKNAFKTVVEKYIWFLQFNFDNLINCEELEKKKYYINSIRKELRICLRQKIINKPVKKNERLYYIAYPRFIKLYFLKKRILKKIKRMISC